MIENYFFGVDEDVRDDRFFALLIYDIVDNRQRTRFAKLMLGYGYRVQKSAFEVMLTKKKYNQMISQIPGYCSKEDSIRIYRITGKSQVTCWGYKDITDENEVILI